MDNIDVLQLPVGYAYHVKNRTNCNRKSGGIVVIYKQALAKHIIFLNCDSQFFLWFDIVKVLPIPNKILFGCLYISPDNTRYSSDNAFNELEGKMIKFSRNTKHIFLLGDFNSRTLKMLDFVIPDDTRHNHYGVKLIMSKRCAMFIANGQLFKDQNIGRMTCRESSIVDYLILAPEAFKIVTECEILDFNPMFSDIHKKLHFVISLNEYAPLHNEKVHVQHNRIRWNENKADEFRQALMDSVLLGEINTALDNLIDSNCITADQVNTIVNHLGSLLIHSATSAFSISKNRHDSGKSKPWFNKECKTKRDAFHEVKNRNSVDKFDEVKTLLKKRSKEYKKELNLNYKKHQENKNVPMNSILYLKPTQKLLGIR